MELNPRQQKLAFAIIVVILAGLGLYLLFPQAAARPHAAQSPAATTPAQTAPPTPAVASPQQPISTPSTTPSTGAGGGAVNIYQWLPFTPADLAKAASVVTQAAAYYDTFRYGESAATYGSRLSDLVTPQYLKVLEGDYATFGVAQQRTKSKETSTANAMINSLRAFDQSSITFVVTISQRIQEVSGTRTPSSQFAITVVSVGGTWQVNQVQPATAGNL